jgi:hypothetical protein
MGRVAAVTALAGGSLLSTGTVAASASPRAAGSSCNDSWTGTAGDGQWFTAGNWSTGTPTTSSNVCIGNTKTGTYTVTVKGADADINSLTLGGKSGTQTLRVDNDSVHFEIGAASTIGTHGVLILGDSTDNSYASLVDINSDGAVVTNSGVFETTGTAGEAYIEADVVNDATMTLAATTTNEDTYAGDVTVTNDGTLTVAAGATYDIYNGSGFANLAGTVTNNGTFDQSGATFVERAATTTGTPIELNGLTFDDDTSAGTGAFVFSGGDSTLAGTGTSPGIAQGQTLTLQNTGTHLFVSQNYTNDGTLNLGATGTGTGYASLVDTNSDGQILTNDGTLATAGTGPAYIEADVVNDATMTLAATTTNEDTYAGDVTVTNDGTLTVADGSAFDVNGGASLDLAGGTLAMTNDVAAGTSSVINGGNDTLGGRLDVVTVGKPALGSTYQPIENATTTGTLTSLLFGPYAYSVAYASTGVTLTAVTPFTLTSKSIKAYEDIPAKVTAATIVPGAQAGATYTATINWGDGTSSNGSVSGNKVTGSHHYTSTGTYHVTTTVSDQYGTVQSTTTTAKVTVPPAPTVTAVSPSSVTAGKSATLTITGTEFTTNSAVTFSTPGISVTATTFKSATSLSVKVAVAAGTASGPANVTVTTPGGSGLCTACLNVILVPKVTTIKKSLVPGATTTITVKGAYFENGLTVSTSIPGATTGTVTAVTSTSFSVSVTVPAGTAAGDYDLTVTNPGGGTTTYAKLGVS